MKPYVLSPLAEQDLQEIWDYIAQDSADQADRVILAIRKGVRLAAEMPGIGHHREDLPDPSLRVWTVYSYLIIYKPETEPLEVVRIIHGQHHIPDIVGV
ncbi:MAG: type II toxin-antitoxin system RelE/ParE family toxin [Planctomycetota bacterium]|nr:type II toxin-antitoxin system RelE/ParE family toxin [Planctomycetota bacterium]